MKQTELMADKLKNIMLSVVKHFILVLQESLHFVQDDKGKMGFTHFAASYFSSLFLVILIAIPFIASAQAPNPAPVNTILTNFLSLLTVVIKILISSAFVVFGWGIVKLIFTTKAGDAKKISEAKQILLWGIIGIFVLASLGGIVIFLKTYFGIPNNAPIQPPTFTTFLTSYMSSA